MITWHYACDETLLLSGLTGDAAPLNSAAVAYAVYGPSGAIPGGSGTLAYVAASAGNYATEIDAAVTGLMPPGGSYYALIVATSGGFKDTRKVTISVVDREET